MSVSLPPYTCSAYRAAFCIPSIQGLPDTTTARKTATPGVSLTQDKCPKWAWSQLTVELCYSSGRHRSPPHVTSPFPLPPPEGDNSISRQPPSTNAVPSSCGSPYGGISPNPPQQVVSSLTSPTHTEKLSGPPPRKSFPRSGHPQPIFLPTWSFTPT